MNLLIIALMVVTFVLMTIAPQAENSDDTLQTQKNQSTQPNKSKQTDLEG
ncbi:hypothetical protein ACFODO_08815 [Acinetobacter sichuanensis]|uniref:Uncharacterized protein n=1 Tax=Acinetobacter sichuanensis TaxID=2136183 RepID=A0ABV7BEW5_9GAMM|nr:hypothetical protein [Acinetobacter sichuanensis]